MDDFNDSVRAVPTQRAEPPPIFTDEDFAKLHQQYGGPGLTPVPIDTGQPEGDRQPEDGLHPPWLELGELPEYFTHPHGWREGVPNRADATWDDYCDWLMNLSPARKRLLREAPGAPHRVLSDAAPEPPLDLPIPVKANDPREWTRVRPNDSDAVVAWRLRSRAYAEDQAEENEAEAKRVAAEVKALVLDLMLKKRDGLDPFDRKLTPQERMIADDIATQVDVGAARRVLREMIDQRVQEMREASEDPLAFRDLAEVADTARPVEWLVQGFWPAGAFGQIAGAEKTLKSYVTALLALAVASGEPFLGTLDVRRQGAVVVFVGEGSADLWWNRAVHLGRGMGLSEARVRQLPIRLCDAPARVLSNRFQDALAVELARSPALVVVDPLYVFQGAEVNAGNLHEAGEVLNALSKPCTEAGAALVVVNHFTKAGKGDLSLSSITMAGSREWSASWCLMKHHTTPDLDAQTFALELSVGSRYGNGSTWLLSIDLTPLEEETLIHTRDPSWELARLGVQPKVTARDAVLTYVASFGLAGHDHRPTRRDVERYAGATAKHITREDIRVTLKAAIDGQGGQPGPLVVQPGPHSESDGKRVVTRDVVYLASEVAPDLAAGM